MSLNKVILIGNLGKDPEIRYLPTSGAAVATFTLATNRSYKNQQAQKVEETEWHRIVVYGRSAEICGEYLHKGSMVCIEGRLKTNTWDDKEGKKHSRTEIVSDSLKMLGGRNEQSSKSFQENGMQESGVQGNVLPEFSDEDDKIPF